MKDWHESRIASLEQQLKMANEELAEVKADLDLADVINYNEVATYKIIAIVQAVLFLGIWVATL